MASFDIQRRAIRPLQIQKKNVPLDQIIAVEGQNPVAAGIEQGSQIIGQALMKRAQLRQQGEQLAKLGQLTGQDYTGLDLSTATPIASSLIKQRAENLNPQQLLAIQSADPSALSAAFPGGVPRDVASLYETNQNKEESRRLREQQMEALKTEREKNRLEHRTKEKTDIVTKFNTDPGVRKIQTSIDAASNVRELALSGNPIAANAIPTYMARASGEVGNLSEADKRPFGGSQAILNRLQASLQQMANGQLTEDNRKFVLDLADTMESSATSNLDRRAKQVSGQYGQASDFLKPDEIYNTLRPIDVPKPKPVPGFTGKKKSLADKLGL